MPGKESEGFSSTEYLEPQHLRTLMSGNQDVVVVDVRSPEEYERGHIDRAVNIPASDIPGRINELPQDCLIVTVCNQGGNRSMGAAQQLRSLGYEQAIPLKGGMRGWSESSG